MRMENLKLLISHIKRDKGGWRKGRRKIREKYRNGK
jgi:hypothetical protein